jgi:hypothetical protein
MKDYKPYFKQSIERYYQLDAANLIAQVNAEFLVIQSDVAFAATSSNPVDRRLDFAAYFLSLIKVLEKRGEHYDKIREICLEITIAYVQPKNRAEAFLKKLIPKLVGYKITNYFLKIFDSKVSEAGHPDGFVARIITDKNETYSLGYGIDILECGICKLFSKHNAHQYTSILCEVDKITSALAGLELIRHGTIANGAAKCDFRFKLVTN